MFFLCASAVPTEDSRLKTAGTPIGAKALRIACHALAEDAILVTNNTREFERVAGLRLENWADDM